MTDWTSLRYAVADVEGNGQQPPDLVELAVLPITDGTLGEPVTWLARPPRPITRLAAAFTGSRTPKSPAPRHSLTSVPTYGGRSRAGHSSATTRMWTWASCGVS